MIRVSRSHPNSLASSVEGSVVHSQIRLTAAASKSKIGTIRSVDWIGRRVERLMVCPQNDSHATGLSDHNSPSELCWHTKGQQLIETWGLHARRLRPTRFSDFSWWQPCDLKSMDYDTDQVPRSFLSEN